LPPAPALSPLPPHRVRGPPRRRQGTRRLDLARCATSDLRDETPRAPSPAPRALPRARTLARTPHAWGARDGRVPSSGGGVRSCCVTRSPCMLDKGSGDGSPPSPRSSRPGFSLVPRLLFQRVNPNSRQGGKARIDKDGTWDRFL